MTRAPAVLFGLDAAFLIVSGCFGLVADLLSYFAGIGPFGAVFANDPSVIGVVEAHGLAALTGIAVHATRTLASGAYWHWHLAATHALLGGANMAFFRVFDQVGAPEAGIAVTIAHFIMVMAQLSFALGHLHPRTRADPPSR